MFTGWGAVQIGCGVTTKEIRGRPYLYFWHYEERGGRRVQAFRYLGAARSEAARAKLTEAVDAYLERVTAEVRRKRAEVLAGAVPELREALIAGRGHRNPGDADSGAALRDVPRDCGRGATRLDVAGRHDRRAARRGRPREVSAPPRPREEHAGAVQIGCGVTTKSIRGRPYLYFWHYEERGGRRVQAFRYLGAARSEAARAKLTEALDAYLERVTAEVRRKRAEVLARAVPE